MRGKLLKFGRRGQFSPTASNSIAVRDLVNRRVPLKIRSDLQEILETRWRRRLGQHSASNKEEQKKIEALQEVCGHRLSIEWERAKGKQIEGYTRFCLICGAEEVATSFYYTSGKPGFAYHTIKSELPLLITRAAGSFLLRLFWFPLEQIVWEVLEYKERNRKRAQKKR